MFWKNIRALDESLCPAGCKTLETSDHIFVECPNARRIWNVLRITATVGIDGHSGRPARPVLGTARQVHRAVPCRPTGSTDGPSTALKVSCHAVPAQWPDWPSVPVPVQGPTPPDSKKHIQLRIFYRLQVNRFQQVLSYIFQQVLGYLSTSKHLSQIRSNKNVNINN